ncbi:hypothetical protein Scep_016304 [Stephania cephalantha]|uniref:Uncharacterized protein n=1 Tax=Stephania cephalantha TaxID=152367 RepID=A0AAP0NVN5_9MAGN
MECSASSIPSINFTTHQFFLQSTWFFSPPLQRNNLQTAGQEVKLIYLEQATIGFYLMDNNDHFHRLMDEIQSFGGSALPQWVRCAPSTRFIPIDEESALLCEVERAPPYAVIDITQGINHCSLPIHHKSLQQHPKHS